MLICREQKKDQKKLSNQKMTFLKYVRNFVNLVTIFFILTKSQNEDSRAKKRFFVGSKKKRGQKKSSNQKMTFLKVARNYAN